jgi:hypothetical protein
MGITWRDGVNTGLAAAVGVVALAVTNEWGWPLLGSARSGTLAVAILGIAMCTMSGTKEATEAGLRDVGAKVAAGLGGIALVLIVAGLIAGSEPVFMVLVIDILALWLVATIRHSLVGSGAPRPVAQSPAAS